MAADSSDSDSAKGQEPTEGEKPTDLGKGEAASGPAEKISATEQSKTAETSDTDGTPGASGETEPAEKPSAAEEPESGSDESRYPPALIATAVALPVVLVVAVLVAAVLARRLPVEREPLVLGPVPAPAATGEACTKLLPALPADLGEFTKSTLVEPAPPAARAWQRPEGGDAIVLRCGLDRPLEFHRASPLQIVNDVQWFEARDDAAKASTWFAVDRETYIALTVPDGSGPTPLQEVSDTITANLPAKPLDPGPLPN
ncbi:DUF3515 domain-containing protein [Nocardia sp. NPDC050713]|uniref:DUF3515 domain-containing protein n=1 Tax=Nocardia sp. NPDC050713 TaxID=3154511 RepID=UPI0033E0C4A8